MAKANLRPAKERCGYCSGYDLRGTDDCSYPDACKSVPIPSTDVITGKHRIEAERLLALTGQPNLVEAIDALLPVLMNTIDEAGLLADTDPLVRLFFMLYKERLEL